MKMWKYQFIKGQFDEIEHLHSVHSEDLITLRSRYSDLMNSKKIEFNKQLKYYVENHQKQTLAKLAIFEQSLKSKMNESKNVNCNKQGFDKYKKVDPVKEKEKYESQVKMQLERIQKEREKQLKECKKKKEDEYNKEIDKLNLQLKSEEKKIMGRQEKTVNDLKYKQRIEKNEFLKANDKKQGK